MTSEKLTKGMIHRAAAAAGRRGGLARKKALSPERRKEIAAEGGRAKARAA